MRIYIIALLALMLFGCTGEPVPESPEENNTSFVTNTSENSTVEVCAGPVCGSNGMTYETDCDALEAGIISYSDGGCTEICNETDLGIDLAVAGTVSKGNESHSDYCIDSRQLIEYVCLDNAINMDIIMCGDDQECTDGACFDIIEEPVSSDCIGPIEADIYSSESVAMNGTNYSDVCIDFTTVKDFFCRDNNLENINHQCPPGYGCQGGHCIVLPYECYETDEGRDIFHRGRTTVMRGLDTKFVASDECIDGSTLEEHYCLENGKKQTEEIECGSGYSCSSGRCVESDCSDTDGGVDAYEAGRASTEDYGYDDKCIDETELREYYCDGDEIEYKDILCRTGYECDEGHCVSLDSE